MEITFELRIDRPDAEGRCTVRLVACFDAHRLRLATSERCTLKQWDVDGQKFRRSFPGYQDANDGLQALSDRVRKAYRQLRADGQQPTPSLIRAKLAPPEARTPPPAPALVDLLDAFRATLAGRGFRHHTVKGYDTTRNHVAAWVEASGQPLTITDYTVAAHEGVLDHLRVGAGLSQNTIAGIVKHLKPFLAWARDARGAVLDLDPAKLSVERESVTKEWLTAQELPLLERILLPESLVRVRDAFLFCCYTGLRYSDLVDLHAGNVHDWDGGKVLRLTQTKTRTAVSVYLTPPALALLAKYDGTRARLLPSTANQVMNRYLKRIARLAGISTPVEVVEIVAGRVLKRAVEKWELVTMHTARHTFAVQSLMRGMPLAVLQKVLGHARITTTMIYAKVVEDFQHHEMRRVWEDAPPEAAASETATGICDAAPAA